MRHALYATLILAAALVVAVPISAADKTSSGIYLTADDFKNGKLTSEGWSGDSSHKLQLHDVLDKPYIHVTHGNETRKYDKSEVYGFRSTEGRDYRFVGNKEYKILEAKEISIYSIDVLVPRRKGATAPAYFFSVGAAGAVVPLTVTNLKNAFPDNHKFHDTLDMTLKSDSQLTQYDDFHKMYKVNRLLIASTER